MASHYFLKLEQFEGPLDLLLHLIRVHELNIFDIDLFALTQQYLDYLRLLDFKDLADAASFLEMAAVLIEIKSRMLLPNEDEGCVEDELSEEDEAASLKERLLLLDQFRRIADHFAHSPQVGVQIQTNKEWQRLEPLYDHIEAPLKGDKAHLVVLYEQMLESLPDRKPGRVTTQSEKIPLEIFINKMFELVENKKFQLFQALYSKMSSRYDLVANVLSLLQLVRDGRMNCHQEQMLGPVWLYRKDLSASDIPRSGDEEKINMDFTALSPDDLAKSLVEAESKHLAEQEAQESEETVPVLAETNPEPGEELL